MMRSFQNSNQQINNMRPLSKICFFILFIGLALFYIPTAEAFVVRAIEVEGAQGISKDTVLNYLPVKIGDDFNPANSSEVISSLYATGLFGNVSLAQHGNVLVVYVEARPIIGSIVVTGNKLLPKDKLETVLKNVGLVQGQVFDRSVLARMVRSMQSQYDEQGKYNAIIKTTITPQTRNRVAIHICISEGQTVLVKQITIIGNCAFSTRKLINQMCLTTPHFWSFFTHGDQFSQEKLNNSLEAISGYYLDRGYLHFKIDSSQATLTPDRKYIYLIIHVTEGPIYTIKGFQLAGNLIVPQEQLECAIGLRPGSIFSRQAIRATTGAISQILGNVGYLFANVNVSPEVDEQNHQVFLTFFVDPGNRTYVRRISFLGNTKTEDVVLRRVIRQMEGSMASLEDIQESERQLNITGFMAEPTHTETVPVPGAPDQVDLNYKVVEAASASATAGAGYGTQGYVLNAGLTQNNFMGTGNLFGINFSSSPYATSYSLSFTNPYYTDDGVSRAFTFYSQRTTPGAVNVANYTTDVYGGTVNYSIPLSAYGDTLQYGIGYQDLILKIGTDPSRQLRNFVDSYGRHFDQVLLNVGWSRNTLDKAIFPTCGMYQAAGLQLALPGSHSSANYYKASYSVGYFHPIYKDFIFTARGSLGYGAGMGGSKGLPFFANYFAGGIGSTGEVRGFEANSLGPLDSQGNPLGGNELVTSTFGIIFPNPVGEDKLRTTAFIDAGNVYSCKSRAIGGSSAGPIRYSVGLAIDWRVPIMNVLLEVAIAKALNAQPATATRPADQARLFDFTVGTSF